MRQYEVHYEDACSGLAPHEVVGGVDDSDGQSWSEGSPMQSTGARFHVHKIRKCESTEGRHIKRRLVDATSCSRLPPDPDVDDDDDDGQPSSSSSAVHAGGPALAANMSYLQSLGLPSIGTAVPANLSLSLAWLQGAKLILEARVIDYWQPGHCVSGQLAAYLRALGFTVPVEEVGRW